MHRSGTSLITNWLYHCGLQVGECLVEATSSNVEGHFEDIEFLKIHEEILAGNNLNLAGLIHDKELDISIYQLEKLKSVIKVKDQRYEQWGWKEPRTCLFLDVYRELIPGSKYLVILRDYLSVTNSLLKRDFAEIEKIYMARKFLKRTYWKYFRRERRKKRFYREKAEYFLKVWIEYNEHILNLLKDLDQDDYIVINYSVLQKSDRQVFSFLTKTWGFMLKYFPFNDIYKENLMSHPIDLEPYLKDATLLAKAKNVENDLKKYMNAY
jgi:hypothetical protein